MNFAYNMPVFADTLYVYLLRWFLEFGLIKIYGDVCKFDVQITTIVPTKKGLKTIKGLP